MQLAVQAASANNRSRSSSMNYLAHLLLAGAEPEAQVGQVLADFVSAGSIASFGPGIQAGIRAHQRIDAYSDGHPVFAAARRRLRPPYRRFAGVLLDVYFDHFLAKGWDRHGDGGQLADFAEDRYRVLHKYRHLASTRFRIAVEAMCRENWLVGYSDLTGVERALQGISRRCKRENPIASGVSVLLANFEPLQSDFERFFPDLREYALAWVQPARGDHQESRAARDFAAPCSLPSSER